VNQKIAAASPMLISERPRSPRISPAKPPTKSPGYTQAMTTNTARAM
jgi:hypothetical protein